MFDAQETFDTVPNVVVLKKRFLCADRKRCRIFKAKVEFLNITKLSVESIVYSTCNSLHFCSCFINFSVLYHLHGEQTLVCII